MTTEKELETLVKIYAKYDADKKGYVSQLDKPALLRLDADLAKFFNQQLLADGAGKEQLKNNYKRLTLYFHPDRSHLFLPTVTWLENNLSEGSNDGICFKSLATCYDKLANPLKFKEISFEDINSREDCRKWLENLKSKAGTYTSRSFCDSLIGLLDESSYFFDEVGRIKPTGIRTLLTFMPMIFASYGAIIFAQELFALYTLYFLMLKGGQYLERSDTKEIRHLGHALQEISVITATATTTLIVRLLEMTFWISHQCLDAGLGIGSSIFKPLLPDISKDDESPTENLCRDLILAGQHLSEGIQFKTPELKVIAAPLEAYKGLNEQQFLRYWRLGWAKGLSVDSFLFKMRVLDAGSESTEEKLAIAQKELTELKKNKEVYTEGGNTAKAIDTAEQVITLLSGRDPTSMQLVVYNGMNNGG
ncbi:hypothetical protein [Legionella fallonii]|uniref:J domain-containing protein n=1 Tax=Legionella fallonii LLAP-10 TaxID=1212491 RepID=A0A098G368_9GAMM|nr:hypothetical protein [Legionella fallonii]CEG56434.1 conserved protein of unknown function [Legionella fallonii LLAP-10]